MQRLTLGLPALRAWALLAGALLAGGLVAWAGPAGAATTQCRGLAPSRGVPAEATPVPRPGWQERLAQMEEAHSAIDLPRTRLVFLGDSLTARWPRPVWQSHFGRFGPLNLGVGGDRVEWLLWRLQAAQWGEGPRALTPRLAILLIGTNNLSQRGRPEDVAAGIQAVLEFIQGRSPQTRILLLSLWPRRGDAGLQERLSRLNAILATCSDPPRVTVADFGDALRDADGGPDERFFIDGLHLSREGYARVATLLHPLIAQALAGDALPR